MAESFNAQIADAMVHVQIRTLRAGATIAAAIQVQLDLLGKALIAHVQTVDPAEPVRLSTRLKRVEETMAQVFPLLRRTYREITLTSTDDMTTRVLDDMARLTTLVNTTLGVDIVQPVTDRSAVRTQVTTTLFPSPAMPTALSATLPEWWERQMLSMGQHVRDTLRVGVQQEDTLSQLVARVRGTKAQRYQDGLVALSQRNAEAVAQTAMSAGIHQGRVALWESNNSVIKGLVTVVTLDSRTSHICIARSGLMYRLPGYAPMGHSIPYLGGPPWHWKCRSTLNPIFYSYRDLLGAKGARFDSALANLPEGTRASLDGQVPASTTFDAWLTKQPGRIQRQLLGPTRLALWRDGKIELSQLISQVTGRPLRVEELV